MINTPKKRFPIIDKLPPGIKELGKNLLRLPARVKWQYEYLKADKLTREMLVDGLRELGVKKGSVLLVHSSLSRLGFVQGGAKAVIEALLEVLGPEGTLAMPAFGWSPEQGGVFDCRRSHSRLGEISETFRCRSGVLRSCHPTHSVAAFGPQAAFLVGEHLKSKTPFDRFSPYQKLLQLNGDILCLGVSIRYITFYHVYEDLNPNFPLSVYAERPLPVRVIDETGQVTDMMIFYHRDDLAKKRIDHDRFVLARVKKYFEKKGIVKSSKIGGRDSYLLNSGAIVRALDDMLKDGETIYAK
ncbi:MAG: AAC(3) family N-acetyltransferase [Candidatus Margulisbacteria bacterium]|nr:AAC(3) family N-acetyltransferase [Candidatus Margulisiibacteriota bacterium]